MLWMVHQMNLLTKTLYTQAMSYNWIHRTVMSILLSIINWQIINSFVVAMSLWKYFIIEISILLLAKLLIFVYSKMGIDNDGETDTHQ